MSPTVGLRLTAILLAAELSSSVGRASSWLARQNATVRQMVHGRLRNYQPVSVSDKLFFFSRYFDDESFDNKSKVPTYSYT